MNWSHSNGHVLEGLSIPNLMEEWKKRKASRTRCRCPRTEKTRFWSENESLINVEYEHTHGRDRWIVNGRVLSRKLSSTYPDNLKTKIFDKIVTIISTQRFTRLARNRHFNYSGFTQEEDQDLSREKKTTYIFFGQENEKRWQGGDKLISIATT